MRSILSRRLLTSLAAGLLLPLAGCLGSTDTPGFHFSFGWAFSDHPLPEPGPEVPFVVTAGVRSLTVNGTFVIPCTPGGWQPVPSVRTGQITLVVEYREDVGCVAPAARVSYTAALVNVREGTYRLVVQHLNDQHQTGTATVIDQSVTIDAFSQ